MRPSPIGACRSRCSPRPYSESLACIRPIRPVSPSVRSSSKSAATPSAVSSPYPAANRWQVSRQSPTASSAKRPSSSAASAAVEATAPRVPAISSTRTRVRFDASVTASIDATARRRARWVSPPPPLPACTTSASAPRASQAPIEAIARARDFPRNTGSAEAMFTRYGACAIRGPSPLAAQASRNAATCSSVCLGGAHARGLERKTCAQSAPRRRHSRTTPGGGFRSTAHVRPEPHSRKSWIVSP